MIVPSLLLLFSFVQLTFAQLSSADSPAANTVLAERKFNQIYWGKHHKPPARFLTSYTSASTTIPTPTSNPSTTTELPLIEPRKCFGHNHKQIPCNNRRPRRPRKSTEAPDSESSTLGLSSSPTSSSNSSPTPGNAVVRRAFHSFWHSWHDGKAPVPVKLNPADLPFRPFSSSSSFSSSSTTAPSPSQLTKLQKTWAAMKMHHMYDRPHILIDPVPQSTSQSPTSSSTSTSAEAPSTAPAPPDKRRLFSPFLPPGVHLFSDAVPASTKSQATQTSTSTSSFAAAQPTTNPTDSKLELAQPKNHFAPSFALNHLPVHDLPAGSQIMPNNIQGHAVSAPPNPPPQDDAPNIQTPGDLPPANSPPNNQPPSPPLQDPTTHRLNIQRISKIPIRPHPVNNQPPSPPPSIKDQSSSPPDHPQPNIENPSNAQNPSAPMENQELIKKDPPSRVDSKLLP